MRKFKNSIPFLNSTSTEQEEPEELKKEDINHDFSSAKRISGWLRSFQSWAMDNFFQKLTSKLPQFSNSDILMMGGKYYKIEDMTEANKTEGHSDEFTQIKMAPSLERFLHDFQSLFWFSYRRDFPPINSSSYRTDLGWGCMLRSAQMMLARVFVLHFLGLDWPHSKPDEEEDSSKYFKILTWFADNTSAPYSVHNIAQKGLKFGKSIGDWFAPGTAANVLGELVRLHKPDNLKIYVSTDATLYLDEISHLCGTTGAAEWCPLFIIVPLRLGLDKLNEVYYEPLKRTLAFPQSVGIIGGKPRAAMYFVAYQDNEFFCLDPHTVQPSVTIETSTSPLRFPAESFHCDLPQTMHISAIDPSLALGFFCQDRNSFEDLCKRLEELNRKEAQMIGVEKASPNYRVQQKQELSLEEDFVVV